MKNRIMPLTTLLVILLCSSFAFAAPVFQNGDSINYDVMMFENVETWLDNDNDGTVSENDQFYGILSVQNIKYGTETSSGEIWSASNSGTIDSFTAYFANTVTAVNDIGGGNARITLGVGDALGKLGNNEIMAFYVDDGLNATGYTTNQGINQDIANAIDGNLWATFGLVNSTNDYLYTEAPVTPPGGGNDVGMTFGGLSIIQNNTQFTELLSINDPVEDLMDTFVDYYFRSYLAQLVDITTLNGTQAFDSNGDLIPDLFGGDGSEWYFVSNDPAGLRPVPEPATMLLLGSGLIGLAGFARKKKFFKKD